ncbi:MAG: PilZ domain-containing protein [Novosphingobium sp.]
MSGGSRLSVPDPRRGARRAVDFPVIGEHRQRGDVILHVVNISAQGFMVDGAIDLGKGERIIIRLPEIGRIEAFLIWQKGERAGFQFERILRLEDFARLVEALPTPPGFPDPR